MSWVQAERSMCLVSNAIGSGDRAGCGQRFLWKKSGENIGSEELGAHAWGWARRCRARRARSGTRRVRSVASGLLHAVCLRHGCRIAPLDAMYMDRPTPLTSRSCARGSEGKRVDRVPHDERGKASMNSHSLIRPVQFHARNASIARASGRFRSSICTISTSMRRVGQVVQSSHRFQTLPASLPSERGRSLPCLLRVVVARGGLPRLIV